MPALIPAPTGIKTSPIKGYLRNFAPCSEQPLPPRCKYPLFLLKEPKLQTSIYPLTLRKKNRADAACLQPWSLFLTRSSSLSSTLLRMFLHTWGAAYIVGNTLALASDCSGADSWFHHFEALSWASYLATRSQFCVKWLRISFYYCYGNSMCIIWGNLPQTRSTVQDIRNTPSPRNPGSKTLVPEKSYLVTPLTFSRPTTEAV